MADGKKLSVTADAADVIRDVRTYNHGAPIAGEMASVSGVDVGPARQYMGALRGLGTLLEVKFQELMSGVDSACDHSEDSIQSMLELDNEIASALRVSAAGVQGSRSSGGDSPFKW